MTKDERAAAAAEANKALGQVGAPEHRCTAFPGPDDFEGYGPAITDLVFNVATGKWVAGNGEYGTFVSFCPFCALSLAALVQKT